MTMEIYTLTIRFPFDEDDAPWSRTIEVKENFTLRALHKYIQEIVNFDDDHLFQFYLGRNPKNDSNSVPESTALNQIYPANGLKLYYLFDFGDCWLFEIGKSRKKKMADSKTKYPVIIEAHGANPEQYPGYE